VLDVRTSREGETSVVTAHGELDMSTVPALEEAIRAGAGETGRVALDLSGVTFIDSSGLNLLLRSRRESLRDGWELELRSPSQPVLRLLDVTGLDEHLAPVERRPPPDSAEDA
jgi:anti-anti-sigma factor